MDNPLTPLPYENPFEENKRPGFLTFLCVLTFIVSGFSMLSNLFSPVVAPITIEVLQGTSWGTMPGVLDMYEQIIVTPVWQFYLLAFLCATSIVGAVYMLKMKKIGFHIYTIAHLAQLFVNQFVISGSFKPTYFSWFITLLFIGLYAIYYKKFTALEPEPIEPES